VLEGACSLLLDRAVFPQDVYENGPYLFHAPHGYDPEMMGKKWTDTSAEHLRALAQRFAAVEPFAADALESNFKSYLAESGQGFGQQGPILRLAITGVTVGPSVFETMGLLGKEESLERIESICRAH
jgi:glutamyl-tRNA synthetase